MSDGFLCGRRGVACFLPSERRVDACNSVYAITASEMRVRLELEMLFLICGIVASRRTGKLPTLGRQHCRSWLTDIDMPLMN